MEFANLKLDTPVRWRRHLMICCLCIHCSLICPFLLTHVESNALSDWARPTRARAVAKRRRSTHRRQHSNIRNSSVNINSSVDSSSSSSCNNNNNNNNNNNVKNWRDRWRRHVVACWRARLYFDARRKTNCRSWVNDDAFLWSLLIIMINLFEENSWRYVYDVYVAS